MVDYITQEEFDVLDKTFLTITIKKSDKNSDKLVLFTDEGSIELKMRTNDIPYIKDDFSQAFIELINQLQDGLEYKELSSTLLDPNIGLAFTGYTALNRIFGPNGLAYLNRKFKDVDDNDAPVLIINTDVVHIPWECIFMESPLNLNQTTSVEKMIENFWGMHFILARCQFPTLSSHGAPNNLITESYLEKPVTIGVAINDLLVFAKSEQHIFEVIKNDSDNQVDVTMFKNKSDFIKEFLEFLHHQDLRLLHIACHAEIMPGSPFDSCLQLSNEHTFLVRHLQLDTNPMETKLIFLNACETGPGNPLGTIDFVRTFQEYEGVENIIATEGMIHSQVAEQFAITFYENFLQGQYLGVSLQAARKTALKDTQAKNIVSLFYSLYGNPFFHLRNI